MDLDTLLQSNVEEQRFIEDLIKKLMIKNPLEWTTHCSSEEIALAVSDSAGDEIQKEQHYFKLTYSLTAGRTQPLFIMLEYFPHDECFRSLLYTLSVYKNCEYPPRQEDLLYYFEERDLAAPQQCNDGHFQRPDIKGGPLSTLYRSIDEVLVTFHYQKGLEKFKKENEIRTAALEQEKRSKLESLQNLRKALEL